MKIEVAYATVMQSLVVELDVPPETTARQAVLMSELDLAFPTLDLATNPIGVFGNRVGDDEPLVEGDRVELYRPLVIDPKEARRQRAARKP